MTVIPLLKWSVPAWSTLLRARTGQGSRLLLLFLCLSAPAPSPVHAGEQVLYAVAVSAAPVLNRPDFTAVFTPRNGGFPLLDACGKERALEFVALPGTVFKVGKVLKSGALTIYGVTTADYPYATKTGLYVDGRFVRTTGEAPPERPRILPPREEIVDRMVRATGSRYVWGGNVRDGIPALRERFPGSWQGDGDLGILKGVDCSGLLYEATGGYTPRNTESLVSFGSPVAIAGMNPAQIAARLMPLDLVAWKGHVLIVLDRQRIIESRLDCVGHGGGVVIGSVEEVLQRIMKRRIPLDNYGAAQGGFVVRRWYGAPS